MLKSDGNLDTDLKFIAGLSIYSGWKQNLKKNLFPNLISASGLSVH